MRVFRTANVSSLLAAVLLLSSCLKGKGDDLDKGSLRDRLGAAHLPDTIKIQTTGVPIELPDLLSSARQNFQTRSTVELVLHPENLDPGASYSLVNDTTGKTLVEPQILPSMGLDLRDEQAGVDAMALNSNYDIVIRLYPTAAGFQGKLAYSDNILRVLADETEAQKFSTVKLRLHDFPVFSLALGHFASGLQRDAGLQGDFNTMQKPYATNGTQTVLTSGIVPLLNQ